MVKFESASAGSKRAQVVGFIILVRSPETREIADLHSCGEPEIRSTESIADRSEKNFTSLVESVLLFKARDEGGLK